MLALMVYALIISCFGYSKMLLCGAAFENDPETAIGSEYSCKTANWDILLSAYYSSIVLYLLAPVLFFWPQFKVILFSVEFFRAWDLSIWRAHAASLPRPWDLHLKSVEWRVKESFVAVSQPQTIIPARSTPIAIFVIMPQTKTFP